MYLFIYFLNFVLTLSFILKGSCNVFLFIDAIVQTCSLVYTKTCIHTQAGNCACTSRINSRLNTHALLHYYSYIKTLRNCFSYESSQNYTKKDNFQEFFFILRTTSSLNRNFSRFVLIPNRKLVSKYLSSETSNGANVFFRNKQTFERIDSFNCLL